MAIDQAALENSKGNEVVTADMKGKEVVSADKKGKAVVQLGSAHKRPKKYGHFHEEVGPAHFCKVILAPKLECLPMPLQFTKHFAAVPEELKLKTNTGCTWRVTVRVINGGLTLDQGLIPIAAIHQIRIGYLVTFKLVTPDTLKVIVFNDEGIEVVTKCKKHDEAFVMDV